MDSDLLQRDTLLWMAMTLAGVGGGVLATNWMAGVGMMLMAGVFLVVRVLLKQNHYAKKQ